MDVIIIYTAVFICLVWVDTTLVWAFFKLTRNLDSPQPLLLTAESLDEFSTDRYNPMLGLLTPQIPTKLRKQRCHLFQQYLRQMDNDFRHSNSADSTSSVHAFSPCHAVRCSNPERSKFGSSAEFVGEFIFVDPATGRPK